MVYDDPEKSSRHARRIRKVANLSMGKNSSNSWFENGGGPPCNPFILNNVHCNGTASSLEAKATTKSPTSRSSKEIANLSWSTAPASWPPRRASFLGSPVRRTGGQCTMYTGTAHGLSSGCLWVLVYAAGLKTVGDAYLNNSFSGSWTFYRLQPISPHTCYCSIAACRHPAAARPHVPAQQTLTKQSRPKMSNFDWLLFPSCQHIYIV